MTELYETVELPLCAVLARMEQRGFLVDGKALAAFGRDMADRIADLEGRIYDRAGESFNINSPKQLGTVLFEKMQLPHGKKTKTGWSTNADVLEKLRWQAPIVADVLEYRQYAKLKSTYADGLLKVVDPDGRIRTSFQMTVTATGRLSSTEPNLQNIPARTEVGSRIRGMFVAAAGERTGGCGLLPGGAAAPGAYLRGRGYAAGVPVRPGFPYPHGGQGVPCGSGGGNAPDALRAPRR